MDPPMSGATCMESAVASSLRLVVMTRWSSHSTCNSVQMSTIWKTMSPEASTGRYPFSQSVEERRKHSASASSASERAEMPDTEPFVITWSTKREIARHWNITDIVRIDKNSPAATKWYTVRTLQRNMQ